MNLTLHSTVVPPRTAVKPARAQRSCKLRTAAQAAATSNGTSNGAAVDNGLGYQIQDTFPPGKVTPVSPEVQALLDDQGLDFETSGLQFLTNEARVCSAAHQHD